MESTTCRRFSCEGGRANRIKQSADKSALTKAVTSYRTPKLAQVLLMGFLPNQRIPPQQMLPDLCAGKDFGAEGMDFIHGWVDVVLFVCGPGGAGFASGEQAAVVNQS